MNDVWAFKMTAVTYVLRLGWGAELLVCFRSFYFGLAVPRDLTRVNLRKTNSLKEIRVLSI